MSSNKKSKATVDFHRCSNAMQQTSKSPERTPAVAKQKKKKGFSSDTTRSSISAPMSPTRARALSAEVNEPSLAVTSDGVLYDQLVALMTILLKSRASRTFHDFNTMQGYIQTRAVAAVEDELRVIMTRLQQLRGPSANHRVTAYAQLLASLTHDIEAAVFNVDRRAVNSLRNDQIAAKVEAEQQQMAFNEKLARKDQTILSLQAEHANMDFKNKSLIRTVELLSKELEKCNSNLTSVHQRSVEIRMQAIDFKAEVDKRAQRVLQSIQARVGFVPETIQKHINQLTALLPPGDANYDRVRMELYKKAVANGSSSAPGTPTSTSRKAAAFIAAGLQIQPPNQTGSSPRSSFTSSSPASTTNASASNSPPRPSTERSTVPSQASAAPATAPRTSNASGGIALPPGGKEPSAPSTAASKRSPPKDWTPVSIDTSIGSGTALEAGGSPKSRLSPTSRSLERRQMLITSLFPRASFTVQDSTGIADMHFPLQDTEAPVQKQTTAPTKQLALQKPTDGGKVAAVAGKSYTQDWRAVHDRAASNEDADDDDGPGEEGEDESDDGEEADEESDSEDADQDDSDSQEQSEGEDAGDTRTNPSVSQHTFSTLPESDGDSTGSDGAEDEVDSTSPGADDEQPVGIATHTHGHKHSAAHATAHGTTLHYVPRVSAQFSPGGDVKQSSRVAYSESDEGGDFYENMKKFLQTFQESQMIDVSDSEMDGDQHVQQHLHHPSQHTGSAAAAAAAGKRRAGKGNKGKTAGKAGTAAPAPAVRKGSGMRAN